RPSYLRALCTEGGATEGRPYRSCINARAYRLRLAGRPLRFLGRTSAAARETGAAIVATSAGPAAGTDCPVRSILSILMPQSIAIRKSNPQIARVRSQ